MADKRLAVLIALIIALTCVRAEILPVNNPQGLYNWGDKLELSFSLSSDKELDAFFRVSLLCGDAGEFEYYVRPLTLSAGEWKALQLEPLNIKEPMLGTCTARARLIGLDKQILAEQSSNAFSITHELPITLSASSFLLNPGDTLTINGMVKPTYAPFRGATLHLNFDGDQVTSLTRQDFNISLVFPATLKSGRHPIGIIINDAFGNSGNATLNVAVSQVPTKLANVIDRSEYTPEETISFVPLLLDQAKDAIEVTALIRITGPDNEKLIEATSNTGKKFTYTLPKFAKPGYYIIRTEAGSLSVETKLTVQAVVLLDVQFDNRSMTFTNLGNTQYKSTVELGITDQTGYTSPMKKELDLSPGKSASVDFFAELPDGTYTISVKHDNKTTDYQSVAIVDKRSAGKVTGDMIKDITARAMGSGKYSGNGILMRTPVLASLIVVAAILGTGIYFAVRRADRRRMLAEKQVEEDAADTMKRIRAAKEEEPAKEQQDLSVRENPDIQRFIRDQLKRE